MIQVFLAGFLPGLLSNTGVQLNYTHVESEIDYCTNSLCTAFVTNDLAQLSPTAYNGTLYYEDDRFSARVSAVREARPDYLFLAIPSPRKEFWLAEHLEELVEATTVPKDNLCRACFDGVYPVKLPEPEDLGKHLLELHDVTGADGVRASVGGGGASDALDRP